MRFVSILFLLEFLSILLGSFPSTFLSYFPLCELKEELTFFEQGTDLQACYNYEPHIYCPAVSCCVMWGGGVTLLQQGPHML